jgi:hypothetical protein
MTTADLINVALTFVTALMAAGTFCLAWYTRNLVKDTAEGIKQAERHHQESLRPFCVIAFKYHTNQDPFGIGWNSIKSRLAEVKMRGEGSPPPAVTLAIRGELRNKGKGLAKEVVVYLNKRLRSGEEHSYRLTRPVVVSGLIGAREAIIIDVPITERDVMQIRDGSGWRPFETIPFIINDTYEVVLEYKDVFGNVFRTVHPRGLWLDQSDVAVIGDDKAKQHEMMITHNKPTPYFLIGRQAVRTVADINIPFAPQAHEPIEPDEPQ